MDWNLRRITCRQMMKQLEAIQKLNMPATGWVRTIRKALGMTSIQLAKKCGVSKVRILRIERDEISGHTTLATLEKVAEQLGCRLIYALVPEKDLLLVIEEQAEKKALEKLSYISHSMALEDQKIEATMHQQQVEMLKEKLMEQNIKSIWD